MNVDRELEALGVTDCLSVADHDFHAACALCGEQVKAVREHEHYKGKTYHTYCLLLTVIRRAETEQKVIDAALALAKIPDTVDFREQFEEAEYVLWQAARALADSISTEGEK